jgi:hypothetical protein
MMTIIYWYRLAGPANFAQIVAKPQGRPVGRQLDLRRKSIRT